MTTAPTGRATAPPLLATEPDVLACVTALVGAALTDRQLWVMLVDGDDQQAPVVVPIAGMPHLPDRRGLDALTRVLSGVAAGLATPRGPGAVIFVWERLGAADAVAADHAWTAALADVAHAAALRPRGCYLSTPAGVTLPRRTPTGPDAERPPR